MKSLMKKWIQIFPQENFLSIWRGRFHFCCKVWCFCFFRGMKSTSAKGAIIIKKVAETMMRTTNIHSVVFFFLVLFERKYYRSGEKRSPLQLLYLRTLEEQTVISLKNHILVKNLQKIYTFKNLRNYSKLPISILYSLWGVIHKSCGQKFGLFWPPSPLCWLFYLLSLSYKRQVY